ncbi:hypothetical protein E4T56_gene18579 [Termitomyces sp. T112]|nr:hypothetical protein E4T56_gene18579 [Termitomyces sp. T112]
MFETAGSKIEWVELVAVDKECQQLYEQYKGEGWVQNYNKHFAPPSLEYLLEDLEASMMLLKDFLSSNNQFFFQHSPQKLTIVIEVECSEGCRKEGSANGGDIGEAGPSTPKHAAGGIAKGLVTLLRVVTIPKGKGKGKAKDEDEEEDFVDQFKCLLIRSWLAFYGGERPQ